MIEAGALAADGRLPAERDLCERLRVSRRVLRRALEGLESEAMIWRRRGKGTFLGAPPDPTGALAAELVGETDPMEVMEARLCVEPALAAMSARRARPGDVARMRTLAERTIATSDPETTELWDGALHRLIARTAGNRPLLTALSMLDEIRATEAWRDIRARARSAETVMISDRQHRGIIDAIAAGRPAAAEAAMRAHLRTLAENLARILRDADGAAAPADPTRGAPTGWGGDT